MPALQTLRFYSPTKARLAEDCCSCAMLAVLPRHIEGRPSHWKGHDVRYQFDWHRSYDPDIVVHMANDGSLATVAFGRLISSGRLLSGHRILEVVHGRAGCIAADRSRQDLNDEIDAGAHHDPPPRTASGAGCRVPVGLA